MAASHSTSIPDLDHEIIDTRLNTFGFEFEVNDSKIYIKDKGKLIRKKKNLLPSKIVVKKSGSGLVRLESDCGHAEYITNPIKAGEKEALENTIKEFEELLSDFKKDKKPVVYPDTFTSSKHYKEVTTPIQEDKFSEFSQINVAVQESDQKGRLQATLGIPLENLHELFERKKTWSSLVKNNWLLSQEKIDEILQGHYLNQASNELRGFILLIEHYVFWLKNTGQSKQHDQGPKQLCL